MIKLIFQTGPNAGQEYFITQDITFIGRSTGCDIEIKDIKVSKQHCKIVKMPAAYFIADLNSTNGTYLNGIPIQEERLYADDRIILGDSLVVVAGTLAKREKKGTTTIIKDAYKELESGKNYEILLAETVGKANQHESNIRPKKTDGARNAIKLYEEDILEKKVLSSKEQVIVLKEGKEIKDLSPSSVLEIDGKKFSIAEIRFSQKDGLVEYKLVQQ